MKDFFESLKKRYHYAMVVFKELVKTDFQLRYQGSFLGMVWSVLKPLMLFAVGARRLPLATVGFLQYIAPSLNFLVAVLLFREPFDTTQLVGFALIWLALAVYSADMVRAGRQAARRAR